MCAWTTRAAMPGWSSAPAARARQPAPEPDFTGLGKIAALGIKVSRHCTYHGGAQRRYGPGTLFPHQPLRLRRAATVDLSTIGVQTTWDEAASVLGRQLIARLAPERKTMSTNEVVREAQSAENYNPLAKQKAAAKLARIPVKVEQAEVLKKPEWIRVKAGSPSTRFYEIKDILRRTSCTRSARKPAARISANASARARPPS
jgi:hypothetical protein